MHLYIHIINDTERVVDPDGQEFPDLEAAAQEANQVARDLIAQELLNGRSVPFSWRVQIAEGDDTVQQTIKFRDVAGVEWPERRVPALAPSNTHLNVQHLENVHGEIQTRFGEFWQHVQVLSNLTKSLKTG